MVFFLIIIVLNEERAFIFSLKFSQNLEKNVEIPSDRNFKYFFQTCENIMQKIHIYINKSTSKNILEKRKKREV